MESQHEAESVYRIVKERDELKEALENLLQSFKKLDSGRYMELSEEFTQYNIKKAYKILNKYNPVLRK